MLSKTITYTDYNGVTRTEDFYFNLTPSEVTEMELGTDEGFSSLIKRVTNSRDLPEIVKIFKGLILKAYGEKSSDGKRFIKSEELSIAFSQTEAYSTLFMECATDSEAAAAFINGIMPTEALDKISDKLNKLSVLD